MSLDKKCCGNCRYHVKSGIPSEGEWICNNGEAEEYGIETPAEYWCLDYTEKNEGRDFNSKSLLLLDTPENCTECPLECGIEDEKKGLILNANICRGCGERNFKSDEKPDWCPLLKVPEKKKEYRKMRCENGVHLKTIGFNKGFNACIEEITKESEKKWQN